jgi:hypothetical protein
VIQWQARNACCLVSYLFQGAASYGYGYLFALFVTTLLREMPGMWKSRHRFVLCWLLLMQALFPGRKTLEELARRCDPALGVVFAMTRTWKTVKEGPQRLGDACAL